MSADHIEQASAVVSLFTITAYGLGWSRPDIGLRAWRLAGRPTSHPILPLVDDWWGDETQLIEAWGCNPTCGASVKLDASIRTAIGLPGWKGPDRPPRRPDLEGREWLVKHAFGGGDSVHASHHADSAVYQGARSGETRWLLEGRGVPRAILIIDAWPGWHATLATQGVTLPERARSWQVEVIVRPFGSLGTYRRSLNEPPWVLRRV